MSDFNVNSDLANKLAGGMKGGTVELPFPVVYAWVTSGQPSYKNQGGALYYGGLMCKREDMDAAADQNGYAVPSDWKQVSVATRDGSEFEAYATRFAVIAPFAKRLSWLTKDGQRVTKYEDGARRHMQVLAWLASNESTQEKRAFRPFGPVVLTAKGFQAKNMLDAFSGWHKSSSQARNKFANGLPSNLFYMFLGTFGKERVVVNVGKPGAQSPITPIRYFTPDNIDEALLKDLFVGDIVAERMSECLDEAQDWLKAWDTPQANDQFKAGDEYGSVQPPDQNDEFVVPF